MFLARYLDKKIREIEEGDRSQSVRRGSVVNNIADGGRQLLGVFFGTDEAGKTSSNETIRNGGENTDRWTAKKCDKEINDFEDLDGWEGDDIAVNEYTEESSGDERRRAATEQPTPVATAHVEENPAFIIPGPSQPSQSEPSIDNLSSFLRRNAETLRPLQGAFFDPLRSFVVNTLLFSPTDSSPGGDEDAGSFSPKTKSPFSNLNNGDTLDAALDLLLGSEAGFRKPLSPELKQSLEDMQQNLLSAFLFRPDGTDANQKESIISRDCKKIALEESYERNIILTQRFLMEEGCASEELPLSVDVSASYEEQYFQLLQRALSTSKAQLVDENARLLLFEQTEFLRLIDEVGVEKKAIFATLKQNIDACRHLQEEIENLRETSTPQAILQLELSPTLDRLHEALIAKKYLDAARVINDTLQRSQSALSRQDYSVALDLMENAARFVLENAFSVSDGQWLFENATRQCIVARIKFLLSCTVSHWACLLQMSATSVNWGSRSCLRLLEALRSSTEAPDTPEEPLFSRLSSAFLQKSTKKSLKNLHSAAIALLRCQRVDRVSTSLEHGVIPVDYEAPFAAPARLYTAKDEAGLVPLSNTSDPQILYAAAALATPLLLRFKLLYEDPRSPLARLDRPQDAFTYMSDSIGGHATFLLTGFPEGSSSGLNSPVRSPPPLTRLTNIGASPADDLTTAFLDILAAAIGEMTLSRCRVLQASRSFVMAGNKKKQENKGALMPFQILQEDMEPVADSPVVLPPENVPAANSDGLPDAETFGYLIHRTLDMALLCLETIAEISPSSVQYAAITPAILSESPASEPFSAMFRTEEVR